MKTKNMSIRKFFKVLDDYGLSIIKDNVSLPDEVIRKEYHYNIFNCYIDEDLKKLYKASEEKTYKTIIVEVAMVIMVMICDTYEHLRNKEKLQGLDDDEQILLYRILAGITDNDFNYILNDSASLEYCVDVTEMYLEESALRKIELAKSLSEEDVATLSKFNIYFEEEYNHYNIEITEQFLLKHLNIWIKKSGLEEGINTITSFVLNLYTLDPEGFAKVASIIVPDEDKRQSFMKEINNKDINTIAPFISSFYESHNNIDKKLK